MDRARNIIAELKKLPDTKNNTEIDILDDVVNDLGKKNSIYEISSEEFTSYFLPFAMRLTRV